MSKESWPALEFFHCKLPLFSVQLCVVFWVSIEAKSNKLKLFKDKVSRRPGVETDITTRAIYNESTCTLSGQLHLLSPFPLDAESGSPDTWNALLGKRPSSVRRSIKLYLYTFYQFLPWRIQILGTLSPQYQWPSMLHLTHWTRKESLFLKVGQRTETGVCVWKMGLTWGLHVPVIYSQCRFLINQCS